MTAIGFHLVATIKRTSVKGAEVHLAKLVQDGVEGTVAVALRGLTRQQLHLETI